MKIQLVIFAVAGFFLSCASALGDGLNLSPKNLYDQISSQVRAPLRAETSAVRSVIDTMKDLQQKLQSDQLRSTYDATSPLRNPQIHHQSYQNERVLNAPQNIRREELIQIREHQVVPSPHFAQQSGVVSAFSAGENQALFNNRNSQDVRRQVYQNKQQVEKFNQELSYITTQNPVHQQTRQQEQQNAFNAPSTVSIQQSNNNQQRYVFPQRSIDKRQETVVQKSFQQETVLPQQSNDGRQETVTSKSIHQQEFEAQRSNQNQQENTQRFNSNQNQQDINAQRFNGNQNQQDINTQRFNNQNQQDIHAQRFNNNQNQQRQYQNEDKNEYRVAIPQQFQENRPQIVSYDLFNRNIELNGQRSYHASNQLNQAYANRNAQNEPRKSSERDQQLFRFENKSNLSSENAFGQNNQNEKVQVSGPVPVILNVASNIKGTTFTRQQLKTPFTVFNNGHLL